MMGVREKMLDEFGPDVLKKPVSKNEFYATVDAMTEAHKALKERLDAIDGQKALKPRVRVAAGREEAA